MKKQIIHTCAKGHLYYSKEPPKICKICGSEDFGEIQADVVDLEGEDELSAESRYYYS